MKQHLYTVRQALEAINQLVWLGEDFSVRFLPESRCWILEVQEKGDKKHEGAAEA